MIAVVTGAAGFVGSSLTGRLLDDGHTVIGIDCLTKAYDVELKTRNLDRFLGHPNFQLHYSDLAEHSPTGPVSDADVVFHLAGQASVTSSWGGGFSDYARNNVEATQRLLEACVGAGLERFVYASSSSIYGDALVMPTPESAMPRPISPYGVTKLAAEHLCDAYHRQRGLPVTSLRFFTVYGPGQRPDMAFHKLFRAAYGGDRFHVRGDGSATRDFTFVDDVVDALLLAAGAGWNGALNVGGGHRVTLLEVLRLVEELTGPLDVEFVPTLAGDARNTSADVSLAREVLGYQPSVGLPEGLARMASWARGLLVPQLSYP